MNFGPKISTAPKTAIRSSQYIMLYIVYTPVSVQSGVNMIRVHCIVFMKQPFHSYQSLITQLYRTSVLVVIYEQPTVRSPCVISRNLLRLQEERNWCALDITHTVGSCTEASTKLTVCLCRVQEKRLKGPVEGRQTQRGSSQFNYYYYFM